MKNRFHPLLTAALWAGFFSVFVSLPAEAGFIQNGEFDEQNAHGEFIGWETDSFFAAPTGNADSAGNFAVFSDSQLGSLFGPFGVQIQQSIVIPQGAVSLSFDYFFGSNVLSESSSIPDSFQASLLDLSSSPPSGVFAAGDPVFQPAFFSVDDRGDALSGVGVSVTQVAVGLRDDWSRVSVDLSDLSSLPESDLLLEFVLFDGTDSNVQSTVLLDNVVIQASTGVIPEPGALVIWLLMVGTVGCYAVYRQRSIRTACDAACPPEPKLRRVIQ